MQSNISHHTNLSLSLSVSLVIARQHVQPMRFWRAAACVVHRRDRAMWSRRAAARRRRVRSTRLQHRACSVAPALVYVMLPNNAVVCRVCVLISDRQLHK
jgi:hypothetical protein